MTKTAVVLASLAVLLAANPFASAAAQTAATASSPSSTDHPAQSVSGVIRVWGNAQLNTLVHRWEIGFRRSHPQVRIEAHLIGSDAAMAGLYTGMADLALVGRPSTPNEDKAFEWIFRYKPQQIEIMTGSLDHPGKSPALVAFVHQGNPLSQLSVDQLNAIFEYGQRSGATQDRRTWGELGLKGSWADKPVHLYTYDMDSGSGQFFKNTVLGGSNRIDWKHLREFTGSLDHGLPADDAGQQALKALETDPYGLAVANLLPRLDPRIKPLKLAATDDSQPVEPNADNLVSRQYPLTRSISAYVNHAPNKALDPTVAEFLRYILSSEGQAIVVHDGQYLPLSTKLVQEQLPKLN